MVQALLEVLWPPLSPEKRRITQIPSPPLSPEILIFQVPLVAPHKKMSPHICVSSQFWLPVSDTKLLVLNNYPVAVYFPC